ncbi:MAG TPA: hypothetical protein VKV77_00675 [Methylovirgula sp.]|nr:hypothetical protein [Methylovirgula sp.]
MSSAIFSAVAVLAGSAMGGVTSIASTLLAQRSQTRAQQLAEHISKLETLYGEFIDEASRLYVQAVTHDSPQPGDFVNLYAKVGKMRFMSSAPVVASAEGVIRILVETYLQPNKNLEQLKADLDKEALDPLRQFSDACRAELRNELDLLILAPGGARRARNGEAIHDLAASTARHFRTARANPVVRPE